MCISQPLYATQQRTVGITFPPNLQTIITAQMLSIGGEGAPLDGQSIAITKSDELPHITVQYVMYFPFGRSQHAFT